MATDDDQIMQAYALGLTESTQKQPPNRQLHQSKLPPESKDWKIMLHHQFKDEFTQATHTEIDGLTIQGIYSV